MGDGGRDHGVLQHQVPTDDPREQLAHGGVRVGVGRARHRHHRRELRVAQRREDAGDPGHHEREDERRAGLVVGRLAGEDEDPRADDGAHPEARELHRPQDAPQAVLALHLLEQQAQWLGRKQLLSHPRSSLGAQ